MSTASKATFKIKKLRNVKNAKILIAIAAGNHLINVIGVNMDILKRMAPAGMYALETINW